MKYRVKTDMLSGLCNGELLDLHLEGAGRIYKGSDSGFVIGESIIDRNPDWFEPIEDVQEGQYWERNGVIKRIEKVDDTCSLPVCYNVITGSNNKGGSCTRAFLIEHCPHKKLSTDEIKEALIKEAGRRGYPKKQFNSLDESLVNFSPNRWVYDDFYDALFYNERVAYKKGDWAEFIDKGINRKAANIADRYNISEKMKVRLEMDIVRLLWEYAQAHTQQRLNELENILPDTFYADRDLEFRLKMMVKKWQRGVEIANSFDELKERVGEFKGERDAAYLRGKILQLIDEATDG